MPIKNFSVIMLAAGQGKRMHQAFPGVPKVLVPLAGKPMLLRALDAVERADVAEEIIVVVGPAVEEKVRDALADREVTLALQPEPLGTAHAVLCAESAASSAEHVLVLYGDQPLLSARTVRRIVETHMNGTAPVTMLTVPLPDFKEWRSSFADWGRVIRGADGVFEKSVEAKDATGHELRVTEVNPCIYCFRADWLWEHLPKVGSKNVQGEFYLPDILGMAVAEGAPVQTIAIEEPREALGANTPEQLAVLEAVYDQVKDLWKAQEAMLF